MEGTAVSSIESSSFFALVFPELVFCVYELCVSYSIVQHSCLFLAWLLDDLWFLVGGGSLVVGRDRLLVVGLDGLLGEGSVLAGLGSRHHHRAWRLDGLINPELFLVL